MQVERIQLNFYDSPQRGKDVLAALAPSNPWLKVLFPFRRLEKHRVDTIYQNIVGCVYKFCDCLAPCVKMSTFVCWPVCMCVYEN